MKSPFFSTLWPASAPTSHLRMFRSARFTALSLGLLVFASMAASSAQAQNLTSFGTAAVGTPTTQSVPVPVSASGTVATVAVLTTGSPNLDFTEAAAGDTCAGNSFTAPTSCTVNVTFSPLYPGPRTGAVVLEDASGKTLGLEYLTGTGQGSLAVMIPGTISIVAGQVGEWTQIDDGQPATQADLDLPSATALDGAGDIFIADSSHNRVREVIASTGNITTVAGNGSAGYDPAATIATATTLTAPGGVAVDGAGNLYIADTDNNVIREVNLTTGAIQTVAGNGTSGYSGDSAAASAAELNSPQGVTVDAAGNLYIADTGNNVIRKVTASTGIITTIAGGGTTPSTCAGSKDSMGDGCVATSATLIAPYGVAFDPTGNMYIPDSGDNLVRVVNGTNVINIYAGNGTAGFSGDGGQARSAQLYSPLGVACDAAGDLYIADARNYVIRKVSATSHRIFTIAGNNNSSIYNDGKSGYTYGNKQSGEQYTGNGIANAGVSPTLVGAGIYAPYGVAVDPSGNLYVAEYYDHVIRKITASAATLFFSPAQWIGQVSGPLNQTVENDGNSTLSFSAISSDTNSTVNPASTCSTTSTVAVGDQCTIHAEFSPTVSGNPLAGDISLTTDLNSSLTIAAVGQALAQNAPVVTVTSTPNPSSYGQTVNFTVAVAKSPSAPLTPSGTVTLYDLFPAPATPPTVPNPPSPPPGVAIGTGTLNANGTVTINNSTLAAGTHDIYAAYSGDTYYAAANTATAYVQQVNEAVTVTLTNSSGNNPSTYGTSVTFTANVTVSGGVSTSGTSVSFYDGAAFLGSSPVDSSNNATYATSALTPGNHSINATYTDANGVSGTSANYIQGVKQTTATVVTSNEAGNQSTFGASVTFTATVTATGPDVPGGTVDFYDGANKIGTGTLTAGSGTTATATYTTSTLAVGTHSITAVYAGDTDDFSSTSAVYTLTVNATTTTTTMTTSATPAIVGTSVTFTANVTSAGGNVPTGTVNFYNGAALLGSGTLNGSGVATYKTSNLPVGAYSLTASYQGDTNDGSSTSTPPVPFSVIQATTSVALTASATAIPVTTTVTFTATVAGNGVTPTGTVTFMDGTTSLGTATLNGSGVATFPTSALSLGQHSITAVYQGDADNAGSTSAPVTVTVGTFSTQTVLAASATTVASNQPVALLATVISSSGKPVAGGTVTFFNGTTNIGTGNIGTNGSASISIELTAGSDTVTAQYSGDTDDAGSTSDAITITVGQATDFSIGINPTSLTIPTGDHANVNISLTSLDGFADSVALGCSSLPPSVTCNFSSTNTPLSANGSASVTLTVDTNSPLVGGSQARNHTPAAPGSSGGALLAFLLPGAGLLSLWRFRRRTGLLKLIAIFAVIAGATMAMNGCGGLSLSSAKPGTYVIQVTATGTKTNVTHVANLTVQVTQ